MEATGANRCLRLYFKRSLGLILGSVSHGTLVLDQLFTPLHSSTPHLIIDTEVLILSRNAMGQLPRSKDFSSCFILSWLKGNFHLGGWIWKIPCVFRSVWFLKMFVRSTGVNDRLINFWKGARNFLSSRKPVWRFLLNHHLISQDNFIRLLSLSTRLTAAFYSHRPHYGKTTCAHKAFTVSRPGHPPRQGHRCLGVLALFL